MLYITADCLIFLLSDGGTKERLINSLKAAKSVHETESDPHKPAPLPTKAATSTSRPIISETASPLDTPPQESLNNSCVHAWTGKEEEVLVSARHDRDEGFRKTKNHTALWKEIANEVGSVTAIQAMHKYNNLKKRWKEVIDSGTGTEAKYFRHRESFDQQYGTRSSTKPSFIIDSTEIDKQESEANVYPQKQVKEVKEKKVSKTKKRKSTEVIDLIKQQDEEFKSTMQQFHDDKMARYDRLLNILERK